jgi:cobalt-zinc-cadmium efflux system outer membrane protein
VKFNYWRNIYFFATAFFIVGCQSYESKPIDIGLYHNSLKTRIVDIEPVSAFADRISVAGGIPSKFDVHDGISPAEGEVIALFYNPELRIARLEAGVSLADFKTAGLWEDPVFGFNGAEISSPSAPFKFGIIGKLTIPVSGRLKVKKSLAGSTYEAKIRSLVNAEWNMRSAIRSQWASWTVASLRVEMINDVIDQLEQINTLANALHEAGEVNKVEYRLLQVELATNKVLSTEIELQRMQEEMTLLALLGLPPEGASLLLPELPEIPITIVDDETVRLIDANTELAIRFARYQTAEETLRLEIKKQYPDIVIGSGYASEFNNHQVLFSLSVPLSIWNRNQAGIAKARTTREVARAEAETTFFRLFRELTLANATLLIKKTQHAYFKEEIVPMLAEQTSDVRKIAALGEVDTFILLETVTRQFDAKQQLLELTLAELDAAITIYKILGPEFQLNPTPANREIQIDTLESTP